MKILELNTEKTWRGGERQTYYNIKGFVERGLDVTLLARRGYPLSRRAAELGVRVVEVGSGVEAYAYLCAHGKEYDIIHAQTAKTQSLAVLSKPFHRRPVVYTRRVSFLPRGPISRLKYERTDWVVAITYEIKRILEGHLGLKRVSFITDVVEIRELDLERAMKLKEEYGGKKILATASALVPHKDPFTMVRAIKELSSLRNDFVFLHFGDGPLLKEAQRLVSELGIGDFYRFMGFVENVEDFYSVFDVFVMSSSQEGIPGSVLDAFVYRVPVVSTDAGGLREAVEGCGLLCRVGDYRCLAQSINTVLEDVSLRNYLVERAYLKATTEHSIDKVTSDYVKLFQSLL